MSISFNHPKDTMTSTSTLELIVLGGTPSLPRPIRFNASSVIVPARGLPVGEMGALVFDTASKTMKYHDGTSWVELLSADDILQPIEVSLTDIYNKLNTKIDRVTYSTSTIPTATISGTTLNIVFPPSSSSGTGPTGLYTSLKPGVIAQYALTSGQTVASIREQMSGVSGGQNGRAGTQANPFITSDGWCLGDGMWWTWQGATGTVTKQVPNISRQAYLRGIDVNGTTKIDAVITGSASISNTTLTVAQLPPLQFTVSGTTGTAGRHYHLFPLDSSTDGTGRPEQAGRSINGYGQTEEAGDHVHTFSGTTNTLGGNQPHTHLISGIDVDHFNVAFLYNIAEPSVALSETVANSRYVLKAGDTMTGALTIANSATIRANDTSLVLYFRNTANAERAAIYHSTTNNTLRLRANGGTEVTIAANGTLFASSLTGTSAVISGNTATVAGRNIVRSVNNTTADASGNVTIDVGTNVVTSVRLGARIMAGVSESPFYAGYVMTGWQYGDKKELRGATYYTAPLQYLVGSTWITVTNVS